MMQKLKIIIDSEQSIFCIYAIVPRVEMTEEERPEV